MHSGRGHERKSSSHDCFFRPMNETPRSIHPPLLKASLWHFATKPRQVFDKKICPLYSSDNNPPVGGQDPSRLTKIPLKKT